MQHCDVTTIKTSFALAIGKKIALLVFVLFWVLIGKIAQAAELIPQSTAGNKITPTQVKMQHIDLFDAARQRPVKITLWYPAGSNCQQQLICLAPNAILQQGILLSHGAMGAAQNYQWLGKALAAQGFITVGVNHYGESWIYGAEHVNPAAVMQFWQRPLDLTFVLNVLQNNQLDNSTIFSQNIQWQNTTAIGHSSGGASVLALAGAEWDLTQAAVYCKTAAAATDRSCAYLVKTTADTAPVAGVVSGSETHQLPALPKQLSWQDNRVKQLVLFDPALGHVANTASLQQLTLPVLVVGSVQNDFLPYARHAGFYASQIPNAKELPLDQGEGHFVYLDSCSHQYQALGVSLCQDRTGVDRSKVQQQLLPAVLSLLQP
jgi:predicted dienelactone hydrolase